jgi:hypothetical protein
MLALSLSGVSLSTWWNMLTLDGCPPPNVGSGCGSSCLILMGLTLRSCCLVRDFFCVVGVTAPMFSLFSIY